MYKDKQVAVGLIIDKNKENGLKLIEQLKSIDIIDNIIIIENQNHNLNIKNDYLKIHYIKNNQFNIIKTTNKILNFCSQRQIEHIFIIKDNVNIKNKDVFCNYIKLNLAFDLTFLSFNNTDKPVFVKEEIKLKINTTLYNDFYYINNNVLKYLDLLDEKCDESIYLEEFYYRLLRKESIILNLFTFFDLYNSEEYLELIDKNIPVIKNIDYIIQKHKVVQKEKQNFSVFNPELINGYLKYKIKVVQIKNKKEYSTVLCVIAKQENNYLDEWIQYNFQLGFDHIFIYQNNCKIELKHYYPYVTIIEWNLTEWQQLQANMHCLRKIGPKTDFMAFFDVDEFLYIKNGKSLKEFLKEYSDCFGIAINWRLFGDNDLTKVQNDNYQVLTRFTKCCKNLRGEVKLILNCQLINELNSLDNILFYSAHHINYPVKNLDRDIVSRQWNNNITKQDYPAQIYHYSTKTLEQFVKFKATKGRADLKEDRKHDPKEFWKTNNFNDIVNFNLYDSLNKNKNNIYYKFNIANGTSEYIKLEHLKDYKLEKQIQQSFGLKKYNLTEEQKNIEPTVTISVLPPKDIQNMQFFYDETEPYVVYTKVNEKISFYIQLATQKQQTLNQYNALFTIIWKMMFVSAMFKSNTLVVHGMLFQNGVIILGTSGSGKSTLAKRINKEYKNMILCDDNVLLSFVNNKLIAQPLPMLPQIKDEVELSIKEINFEQCVQVKNMFILNKDKDQKVIQISEQEWKEYLFNNCLHLIYQPFAQRNDTYYINNQNSWIRYKQGLEKLAKQRIKQLVNYIYLKKYFVITTNISNIKQNNNKYIKEILSL